MALNTNIKLFPAGRTVYVASPTDKGYLKPLMGTVTKVGKGRLVITTVNGCQTEISAQSRRLCLTREECQFICDIMNGTDALLRQIADTCANVH